MKIAVVAYFIPRREYFQQYFVVVVRPAAADEKGGFRAELFKRFQHFKNVFSALIDIDLDRHLPRVRPAAVNGAAPRHGEHSRTRSDTRAHERKCKKHTYYQHARKAVEPPQSARALRRALPSFLLLFRFYFHNKRYDVFAADMNKRLQNALFFAH